MTTVVDRPETVEPVTYEPGAAPDDRTRALESEPPTVQRAQRATKRDALLVAAQGMTIFGLVIASFVGYLVGLSALEHGRAQRSLRTNFHRDLDFGNAWIGGQIPEGAPVAEVAIEKIGVHEIVAEGTSGALLRSGPGHLRTSPLPGQRGNVVIAGRRVSYGGPFRHLDQLHPGDLIVMTTGQGRSTYRVTRVAEVAKHAPDAIDDFGDDRLTLLTSTPALAASRRLVVTAALRTAPQAVRAAHATDVRTEELGLNSDHSTTYALLMWAQVLLVASLGTAWLRHRWSRWPTYLVALPILALLALLMFDNLGPVLPSTL